MQPFIGWRLVYLTTVEKSFTVAIPKKGMTLEILEAQFSQALKNAGQHLVVQSCEAIEAEMIKPEGSKYLRDKRRKMDPLTSFG